MDVTDVVRAGAKERKEPLAASMYVRHSTQDGREALLYKKSTGWVSGKQLSLLPRSESVRSKAQFLSTHPVRHGACVWGGGEREGAL